MSMTFIEDLADVVSRVNSIQRQHNNIDIDYGYVTQVDNDTLRIKVAQAKDGGRYESDWLLCCSLSGLIPEVPALASTVVVLMSGNQGVWLGTVINDTNPKQQPGYSLKATTTSTTSDSIQVWQVPGQKLELNSTGLYLNGLRVRTI